MGWTMDLEMEARRGHASAGAPAQGFPGEPRRLTHTDTHASEPSDTLLLAQLQRYPKGQPRHAGACASPLLHAPGPLPVAGCLAMQMWGEHPPPRDPLAPGIEGEGPLEAGALKAQRALKGGRSSCARRRLCWSMGGPGWRRALLLLTLQPGIQGGPSPTSVFPSVSRNDRGSSRPQHTGNWKYNHVSEALGTTEFRSSPLFTSAHRSHGLCKAAEPHFPLGGGRGPVQGPASAVGALCPFFPDGTKQDSEARPPSTS